MLTAGYIPTITLPTRLSENSTLIDNVLTNNFSNNGTKDFILNIHISDHEPIMLFTNDQTPATKHTVLQLKQTVMKLNIVFVHLSMTKM